MSFPRHVEFLIATTYIYNAASLQEPLNAYLHNVKKRDKTQKSRQIETSISNAVLLAHPSLQATYYMRYYATRLRAGLQNYLNKSWQSLGYFSNKFSDAPSKYSTYDRELQAIYMAVKHFRKMCH